MRIIISEIKSFLFSFSFLSMIPVRVEGDFSRSVKYFPFFGLILGFILYIIAKIPIESDFSAIFIIFSQYFISNYFHFDGFLDVVDALYSGKSRDEMLKIMSSTLRGSLAILWGIVLILLKFLLIKFFLENGKAIIFSPFFGRLSLMFCAFFSYPAKDSGLGFEFIKSVRERKRENTIFFSIYIIILLFFLPISIIAFVPVFGIFLYLQKKFQGLTGDTFGFIVEISEIIFLITLFFLSFFTVSGNFLSINLTEGKI